MKVHMIFLIFCVMLTPKIFSQPQANQKVHIDLKVDYKPVNIKDATVTTGYGYFTLLGVLDHGEDYSVLNGADLSISLKTVSTVGAYKIYVAEYKSEGKSYFIRESGVLNITEWKGKKIAGNFIFLAKADDGSTKTLEGNFYTELPDVKVKVIALLLCGNDTIPLNYAGIRIGRFKTTTDVYGIAYIKLPPGKYEVTVLNPDPDYRKMGALQYALWKGQKISASSVYEDAAPELGKREGYWAADPIQIQATDERENLILASNNCPYEISSLTKEEGITYRVNRVSGEDTLLHLGSAQLITVGMTIRSGDLIHTGDFSAVLLERTPGSANTNKEMLIIHPNTSFQFYFYKDKYAVVNKHLFASGTFSKKTVHGDTIQITTKSKPSLPPSDGNGKSIVISEEKTIMISGNSWGEEDGTIYSWTYDSTKKLTIVSVEEGAIHITPRNENLQAIVVRAGERVEISPDSISPIMKATPVSSINIGGVKFENIINTDANTDNPKKDSLPVYVFILGGAVLLALVVIYAIVNKKKKT